MDKMRKVLLLLLLLPVIVSGQVGIISTVVGNGTATYTGDNGQASAATINTPPYIVFDNADNLYIVDKGNHVIRKVNAAGVITTIAGNGLPGFSGDNGPATAAQLHTPTCVALDGSGNIYIADGANYRIRKINAMGIITTVAGNGYSGYNGEGVPATNAKINPYGIGIDDHNNLYLSEGGSNRIRKVDASGIINTIAGDGTAGFSGDGGPATAAQFHTLGYITVSSADEILIADWMNHRIRKIDAVGNITTIAGNGGTGNTGDGGRATDATFEAPNAVNLDNDGNIYISDNFADVIRKISASNIITTIAGDGVAGYSGDNGPATIAQLNTPNSVAFNSAGDMYIDDGLNNRIRKITYSSLGILETTQRVSGISLSPNPATNELTIKSANEIEGLEVVNMMGQVVTFHPFGKGSGQANSPKEREMLIDIRSLPAGVYFVKVNGPDGYRDGGRFVKE